MFKRLREGEKMKKLLMTVVAMVAGNAVCGSLVLVPAPRQMKLTGGEYSVQAKCAGDIAVRESTDASLPPEGYRLVVSADGVSVASADAAGAFYARQTLAQLFNDCREKGAKESVALPCLEIVDSPTYRWRGVHFDD